MNKSYNSLLMITSSDQLFELLPLILPMIDVVLILCCIAYIVYVFKKGKLTKEFWLYFLVGGILICIGFLIIGLLSPPVPGIFPWWIILLQVFTIAFGCFAYLVWRFYIFEKYKI